MAVLCRGITPLRLLSVWSNASFTMGKTATIIRRLQQTPMYKTGTGATLKYQSVNFSLPSPIRHHDKPASISILYTITNANIVVQISRSIMKSQMQNPNHSQNETQTLTPHHPYPAGEASPSDYSTSQYASASSSPPVPSAPSSSSSSSSSP